jgi:inward rectifier potassium channel
MRRRRADDGDASAPVIRLIARGGSPPIRRVGVRNPPLRDLYFVLLRMPWGALVPLFFAIYLAITGLFAVLYWLDPNAVAGIRPGHLGDTFFFSVETLATIGYGTYTPKSLYGHCLMTIEAFVGLLAVALLTGLTFAKFSRPTARVIFSRRAVIGPHWGRPTLMFRMANARQSNIVEAQVRATLVRDEVGPDGSWMRRFHDLLLERSWNPVFALTWTALHRIDEASPLASATPEILAACNAEIVVSFIGVDETFGQSVHARFSYVGDEIAWDARFADVFVTSPEGRWVDYRRLHDIERLTP